ncbi:MatE_and transmembrane domain-containing protein [Hexamita inflata]|uniref:MatE and transmembrane domain-containing protein n=1 Tax=Hexamita inflata TaxID=28002 RepID=A0AA86PF93_9EUKA|nr:MatE and transmembrane domain-containing protein [Hexamita inflata]
MYTMNSAFRINMQLKRYDRIYEFFMSSFAFLFINLGFQIITFAIRNIVYKAIFNGEFEDSFQFYHSSIDGLIGTFNAYTMAVIRSDSNMKVGIVVGAFKLILSISFWLVGKYTNNGNSHYSTMVYFYKYCVDIIGLGFFILILLKFVKLRKFNVQEESDINSKQPPTLILQEMQPIDPISRNTSTDRDSKSKDQSKEALTSKEFTKSSKIDLVISQQSQSWTNEEGKDGKTLFGKDD